MKFKQRKQNIIIKIRRNNFFVVVKFDNNICELTITNLLVFFILLLFNKLKKLLY